MNYLLRSCNQAYVLLSTMKKSNIKLIDVRMSERRIVKSAATRVRVWVPKKSNSERNKSS